MYDLDFILVLQMYNVPQDSPSLGTIDLTTPPDDLFIDELLYMTATYALSESGTTIPIETETGRQRENTFPAIYWGIRVFVGGIQITSGLEAVVTGGAEDTMVERTGIWNCPEASIKPTDSITISIRAVIDTTDRTLADFSTGPLGTSELSASQWEVNYWVKWDEPRNDRYTATFGFGDTGSWDSYVDHLAYVISA